MNRNLLTTSKVSLPNGETLHVHVTGTGPDILFLIHGMWLDHRCFEPLFPHLSDRFTLIAPDFRGHGQSSYVNPIKDVNDYVEDMALLIEHFQIEKFYFLAWCGGSSVALKYISMYPDKVIKLIILSPPGLEGHPLWKRGADKSIKTPIEDKADLANHPSLQILTFALKAQNKEAMKMIVDKVNFNLKKPDPAIMESLAEQLLGVNNIEDVAWAAYTCNLTDHKKWVTEGTGAILKVKVDILMFYSEDDTLIPRHAIDQYFEYFGERVTLKLFKDAGHAPHLLYPKEVSEDVIRYVDGV